MTYYVLPQIEYNITSNNLKISFSDKNQNIRQYSLKKYLNKIKSLIDKHIKDWDIIKKYTNPYEFIHTNIPGQKISVSKYKPISRAFFKLYEIYNTHNLFNNNNPIKSFHLAEGPGGFIEATQVIRNNPYDKYYGMTLINDDLNIPNWNKASNLLKNNKNILIEYGHDKKGNLYNYENLIYCKKRYQNSMDIVTADGGFDFSYDYNNQEKNAFRLIFTQIAYAITMQKYNGHFILKIFDIFQRYTIETLYLLSCFYKKIIISKPFTSRYANSEKYIICKSFKYKDTTHIIDKLSNILKIFDGVDFNEHSIFHILNIPLPNYYISQVFEINSILVHQQIDNILQTIKIITNKDRKHDKLHILKNQNIQKCIEWCMNNKISYNHNYKTNNIFLGERIKNK